MTACHAHAHAEEFHDEHGTCLAKSVLTPNRVSRDLRAAQSCSSYSPMCRRSTVRLDGRLDACPSPACSHGLCPAPRRRVRRTPKLHPLRVPQFRRHRTLQGTYNSIAGDAWADWLFLLGLLAIGVALILGVFVNLAAAGALLLVMMWAVVRPENNPFMDDHLIYALTLGLLAGLGAGRWLGLGRKWEQTTLVQKVPVLR